MATYQSGHQERRYVCLRSSLPRLSLAGLATVALFFFVMATSRTPDASETICSQADVHINQREEGRTDLICHAAAEAIRFMASIGIHQQAAIQINVVNVIPGGQTGALGSYDWRDTSVYVRGSEECLGNDDGPYLFNLKCNEAIYKSFVAHEIAHAVSATNFDYKQPSFTTQEYIAAIVQFSVMDARQREEILSAYEIDGFESPSEINLLVYQFDPMGFSVKAFRHFIKEGNGPDFVADLFSGAVKLLDYVQ